MGQARGRIRSQHRNAGDELTRELVFADLTPSYNKFKLKCGPELESAIAAITGAHMALEANTRRWRREQQADYVKLYLHAALNNLLLATHFIAAGYTQPAGHQLRCYAESCAMALLLVLPDQFERFRVDLDTYPAHDSLSLVLRTKNMKRLAELIPIDPMKWQGFIKVAKHYNDHSHSGARSLLLSVKLEWPAHAILGGEYDPHKLREYRFHLKRAASGARTLGPLSTAVGKHFERSTPA